MNGLNGLKEMNDASPKANRDTDCLCEGVVHVQDWMLQDGRASNRRSKVIDAMVLHVRGISMPRENFSPSSSSTGN